MSAITEFSLKTDRITILFMILVVVAGTVTFLTYPSREDPSIRIRNAQVTAVFPGMAPTRVEELITVPLEEAIREIPEVRDIESDSKTGLSLLKVSVRDEVADLDSVWRKLRDKVADRAGDLPQGTEGPFVNDEIGLTAVATIALWSDGYSLGEMRDMAKTVRRELYALDGIKKIELYGVREERIYLDVSSAKIAQFGVTPQVILQALQSQNIILPGGRIDNEGQNIIIEPSGNFTSVEDVESLLFAIPNSDRVAYLRDLLTVRRDFVDPPKNPVYYNGKPAIVLSVSIVDGVNSLAFGESLSRRIEQLQKRLPIGYVLEYATYQPDLVDISISGAVNNLIQTLVIVLAVVMVFLGLRTGLIVGSFVPLAMLLGLIIMRQFEVELQRVSVAAMIIALGMLVDNGIVVAEDIRVRLEHGEERFQAAIASGRALALPLLTSSLTTILFFVPMMLVVGGAGELVRSLGQVVIIVLLASWFLAMYTTPAMCAWFIKVKPRGKAATTAQDEFGGQFYDLYRNFLQRLLRLRLPFLATMVALLVGAGLAMRLVDREFFPLGDRNQYLVFVDLPAGSSINAIDEVVRRLTAWFGDKRANPEVTSTIAYVGNGGPRFFLALAPLDPDPHRAFVLVNVDEPGVVGELVQRTRRHGLDAFPEARITPKEMWFGSAEAGLLQVRLVGDDAVHLTALAAQVRGALRVVPGTVGVKDDWENRVLKIRVAIDQARARRAGVTSEQVAQSMTAFLDGATVTDYREGDQVIPVVLRGVAPERRTLTALRDVTFFSQDTGRPVTLLQIAAFEPEWQFARIKRRNQERTVTIDAKNPRLPAVELLARLQPTLDALDLKPGHYLEIGGEIEKQAEANQRLFANLPLALALVIVLLVWQFNSFRRALVIVLTIPLILIGAVLGLLLMDAKFGFFVLLGLFSLAGIIINNGIVLIDRIDVERAEGRAPLEAVISACLARFRPILMTTLTTILGLVPLIVSRDPLFYGMASAIAFGLAAGTVFTLGVVPALYTLFFRVPIPART